MFLPYSLLIDGLGLTSGQVVLKKELDGITCTLPAATRNMYVDGELGMLYRILVTADCF